MSRVLHQKFQWTPQITTVGHANNPTTRSNKGSISSYWSSSSNKALSFCSSLTIIIIIWKKCYMQCGVWNQMKIWSSHLLDNLSNCLMKMKNSGDSTGFEPMTSAMPVQCSNQLSYEVTQWRAGQFVGLMFSRERNVIWNKCYMQCGVWNQMKIWSSHLLDNLSNCLMNLKNSGDSAGFEPMTSAMPVQCSNQLSYEVTQWRAGQFVGLMFSRERNVIWNKCYMQCGVWNQMKIWSSHLLDNLSNCLMNLKNSGDSTGFEPMTSAEQVNLLGSCFLSRENMSPTNWPALHCVTS